jgi:hypothetical protein
MALAVPQSELDPSVNKSKFNTEAVVAHALGPQELQVGRRNSFRGVIALPDELQLKRKSAADLKRLDDENALTADWFTAIRTTPWTSQQQTDNADPLVLSENNISPIHNCAGRDVTIEASNREFFLAGICHSVTLVGSDDNVMIEISNRGKLMIVGERNVVLWRSGPEGPEPMVISGEGSNTEIHLPSQSATLPLVTMEATRRASVPINP